MAITYGIHHVAYRCKDAKETVEFYRDVFDMDYTTAFAEDYVPSTGEYDPYMHVFLDAGNGNVLAFFELPQPVSAIAMTRAVMPHRQQPRCSSLIIFLCLAISSQDI